MRNVCKTIGLFDVSIALPLEPGVELGLVWECRPTRYVYVRRAKTYRPPQKPPSLPHFPRKRYVMLSQHSEDTSASRLAKASNLTGGIR